MSEDENCKARMIETYLDESSSEAMDQYCAKNLMKGPGFIYDWDRVLAAVEMNRTSDNIKRLRESLK